jgi:hypothetical protein
MRVVEATREIVAPHCVAANGAQQQTSFQRILSSPLYWAECPVGSKPTIRTIVRVFANASLLLEQQNLAVDAGHASEAGFNFCGKLC